MTPKKMIILIVAIQLSISGFSSRAFCVDGLNFQRRTPVVEVYEKTQNTVVNISGVRMETARARTGYYWPDMFDFWGPSISREVSVLGSGVVVHEDGYIITNAHVVKEAEKIKTIFSNGDEFPATKIAADETKDLALLKIDANKQLPFVHLGRSDDLMIGETVIAVGNPYGYASTLTSGVISAIGRDIPVTDDMWLRGLIQTDASINPGNSGGPLFNINGDLIGINTAIRADAENIGFTIPVDTLADNLRQMLMPEKLRRVRLGLVVGRMKTSGDNTGLVVDSVTVPSPANDKGITAGDIILEVDGHKLSNVIDFYIRMMNKEIGEPIEIKYIKPEALISRTKTVELSILERPLPDGRKVAMNIFQMDVSELNETVAKKFGYMNAYPILIITGVQSNGMADEIGLSAGDLIVKIDNTPVSNMEEFSIEMEKISEGDEVEITIIRISVGILGPIRRTYTGTLKAQTMN
jgi:serine protease Do